MTPVLEKRLTQILAWGSLLITIVVTDRISTDPVNVSKMFLLSIVGFSLIPIIFSQKLAIRTKIRTPLLGVIAFIVFASVSVFTSANTFERGLYGAFARNTGALTYTALGLVFLAATLVKLEESYLRILKFLLIAGLVNTVYCLIAASGNDFLVWQNPYNAVLGTFGNPNFIGSFMGIFFTFLAVQILDTNQSARIRITFAVVIPFVVLVIYFAKALQGTLVAAFGLTFAIYFYLRSKKRLEKVASLYLAFVFAAGFIAFLGILQKGPLASLLYKPTVTYRGEYWKAGINMGLSHPFTGVGIDSYGIYYRTFRDLSSTVAPGMNVATDTSHNVFIDIFAGTGFPGLSAYILINGFVLLVALKHLRKFKVFDAKFLTLFLCWSAYQLQSIISINQIGLAIWGWLLGGLILGYVSSQDDIGMTAKSLVSKKGGLKRDSKNQENLLLDASTTLKILVSAVVGLLIALPPFLTDAKMRSFYSGKGDTQSVIALAKSWPVDNLRISKVVTSLAMNNINEEARNLAVFGTTKFPNDYVSWWAVYTLTKDGTSEKSAIKAKLHEIDPYNPEYFSK